MAGLFDEVLASGGYVTRESPEYGMSWNETSQGPRNGYDQYLDQLPLTEDYWRRLGYTGPVQSGGHENPQASPELRAWLQQKNYRMGNNGLLGQNSLVDASGGPVTGSQYSIDDTGDFIRDAAIVGLGGYFGGSALAAAYGGAGAAAGAGGAEALGAAGGYGFTSAEAAGVATQLGEAGAAGGAAAGAGAGAGAGSLLPMGAEAGVGALEAVPAVSGTANGAASSSFLQSLGSGVSNMGAKDWVNIISGIYGMKLAGDARKASDPFGQYRAGYGQQLAALEANPNLITGRPGWRAGIDLIDRQMGARGYLGSGNNRAALSRYAGDFYDKEMSRLAGLAGAGAAPGAGRFQSADLAGQSLASIGYGLAPYFKGGGGGSGGTSGSAVGGDLMYGWGQGLGNYMGGP